MALGKTSILKIGDMEREQLIREEKICVRNPGFVDIAVNKEGIITVMTKHKQRISMT